MGCMLSTLYARVRRFHQPHLVSLISVNDVVVGPSNCVWVYSEWEVGSTMITTCMFGAFRDDGDRRKEMLSLLQLPDEGGVPGEYLSDRIATQHFFAI